MQIISHSWHYYAYFAISHVKTSFIAICGNHPNHSHLFVINIMCPYADIMDITWMVEGELPNQKKYRAIILGSYNFLQGQGKFVCRGCHFLDRSWWGEGEPFFVHGFKERDHIFSWDLYPFCVQIVFNLCRSNICILQDFSQNNTIRYGINI